MADSGGAMSGAASGAAAGTAILPGWGTAIGAVIGGAAGLFGGGGAKKAKAAQEKRYRQMLDLLAKQGQATKADIRAGAVEERAGQVQTAAGRGLYNSSVLDTLQSQSNDREARALAGVDQQVARGQVEVMNDRTDYASDSGSGNSLAAAGQLVAGLVGGFGGAKAGGGTGEAAAGNAVGGVTKSLAKNQTYADRLGQTAGVVPGMPNLGQMNKLATGAAGVAQPMAKLGGRMWDQVRKYRRPSYASYAGSL